MPIATPDDLVHESRRIVELTAHADRARAPAAAIYPRCLVELAAQLAVCNGCHYRHPPVKALLPWIRREALWPLFVVLLAAAVLLPGLGSFGLWEPQEIAVADRARARVEPATDEASIGRLAKGSGDYALTERAAAAGMRHLGTSELAARLPLALLGLIAIAATFFLARRLASPRAGLFAALVLLSMPIFVLQSRQLLSAIGAITGTVLLTVGLVGLAWPHQRLSARPLLRLLDIILIIVGAALSFDAAGLLLGIAPVLGAVGLASLAALLHSNDAARPQRRQLGVAAALTLLASIAALAVVAFIVYDFVEPVPGTRQLGGYSFIPTEVPSATVGGIWRAADNADATFDSLFEQLAYGLYPWSALAPIALARLGLGPREGRRVWAGYIIFGWVLLAWAAATVLTRKVGPVLFPAVGAVAVAVGVWLDDLLTARECAAASADDDAQSRHGYGTALRLPLVGLFVALAALVLGKDLQAFPDRLVSIHVVGSTISYPGGAALRAAVLAFGVLFGGGMFLGLWRWYRRPPHGLRFGRQLRWASRYGVHAAVAVGVGFAVFVAHVWTPRLSRKLSSRHLMRVYSELARPGDALGVMGQLGGGIEYYTGGNYEKLRSRAELVELLQRPERVFALVPTSELCPIHAASKASFDYHVLDDSHAQFLLLSNQLRDGEQARNPLAEAIARTRPADIKTPLDIDYDGKIRLIGVNMPSTVDRGERFEVTLFYQVLANVPGTWKVFVHFDGPGIRFQGDHEPIRGMCGTGAWQPGDFIVDTFEVEAGDLTHPKTTYQVWTGFFRGGGGNWTNMKVVSGQADNDNRARLGTITLN